MDQLPDAAKNYYLIQEIKFGKLENKMVARDFICQASEFDKLLGADPQEAQGGHRLLDLRRSVVKYNILKKFKSLSHCGRFQG
jgi:hypothetical protein